MKVKKHITNNKTEIYNIKSYNKNKFNISCKIAFDNNFINNSPNGLLFLIKNILFEAISYRHQNAIDKFLDDEFLEARCVLEPNCLNIQIKDINKNSNKCFALLKETLSEYRLTEEVLQKAKQNCINSLQKASLFKVCFNDVWNGILYEIPNFYNKFYGSCEEIKNITLNDVKNFYENFVNINNLKINIVSIIPYFILKFKINKYLTNSLPFGKKANQQLIYNKEAGYMPTEYNNYLVEEDEINCIMLELPIKYSKSNDYLVLELVNYLTMSDGILINKLRAEKGYLYNIYSKVYHFKNSYVVLFEFNCSINVLKNIVLDFKECLKTVYKMGIDKKFFTDKYKKYQNKNKFEIKQDYNFRFLDALCHFEKYRISDYKYAKFLKNANCENFTKFYRENFKFSKVAVLTFSKEKMDNPFSKGELNNMFLKVENNE